MMGKGPMLLYPLKMQVLQTPNLDNSCYFGVVSGSIECYSPDFSQIYSSFVLLFILCLEVFE